MTAAVRADARSRWPSYYTVVLLCFAAVFISYLDRTNISVAAISMKERFNWTETTKGMVLSSFFVGYILLQVVAGTLANRLGGKLVLGVAVVWWSLFTVLTPPAALVSLPLLIGARIALGLGEAAVFPASMNMIGRWVPAAYRSRAVAMFSSGLSFGPMTALPVTGWLIKGYGWPMPFYVFGAIGLVWAVFWFTLVSGGNGTEAPTRAESMAVPWRVILRTPGVWAIIIGHFCHNWQLYLLLAWLPSYFKTTFGVTLASSGVYSAAPWAMAFIMGNTGGHLADWMLRSGITPIKVRKTMQGIGMIGPATFMLLLPLAGSAPVAVVLMCAATGLLSFCQSGFAPNCFDIAPKHAGVIFGLSNTFATLPGIFGVYITGWLVDRTGSYTAPFLVTSAVAAVGALAYLRFASAKPQIG